MGLASDMKNLTEELISSFKQRITENEALVNDVQKTLNGFRKDHQEMTAILNANAAALRKDLANGETERLSDYNGIIKGIHVSIKGIRSEVNNIKKYTGGMLDDLLQNRVEASAEWKKMQDTMDQIRKTGIVTTVEEAKKEVKKVAPAFTSFTQEPEILEQNVLGFIDTHAEGVKI